MKRHGVLLIGWAIVLAVLVEVAGFSAHAGAGEKSIPQEELPTQILTLLSDAIVDFKANQFHKQAPCLPDAVTIIWQSLDIPKHASGQCPWCGEKTPKAPTCSMCGLERIAGWSQTGVGSAQTTVSYNVSEKDASGKVSGVLSRKKSVNDEIESTMTVDITYKKECKEHNDETTCASFHAVIEATVTYFESEDHKSVSGVKVSNVSLHLKSLFCCNQRPRLPYEVILSQNTIGSFIKRGDETLETPQPKPSPTQPSSAASPAPSPAAASSAKPINEDPKFKPTEPPSATPAPPPSSGEKTGVDYSPSTASLHDEVLVTAHDTNDQQNQGATEELVDEVDANGQHHAFSALTDEHGHLKFLPLIAGLAVPIVAIDVFHHLKDGGWSSGGSTVVTENPPELPGSQQPENWRPGGGSSIERATSVVDTHGSDTAILQYQTTGTRADSRVVVNGSTTGIETVAASSQSVIALARGLHKGLNTFAIETDGRASNQVVQAVVSAQFVPLPPLHANQIVQLTEKIDGVQGLNAVLHLTVSGAATFADGTTSKWLPVVNGVVTQPIKAAGHAGALDVKSQLYVQTPSFALPSVGGG